MKRNKTQLHRLFALDSLIRDGKYPNALTFAMDWEVSQKTVQRDIEFWRDRAGAPLEYDRVRKGYYYTQPWDVPPPVAQLKSLLDEENLNPSQGLFEAAARGETARIGELIACGGNVNWQDPKDQWTPLMAAAWSRWAEVVAILLKAGARMNIKNVSGDSALTYAVKSGDANIVRQVLTAAAKQGLTADQIALDRARSEQQRKIDRLNEMLKDLDNYQH